MRLVDVAHHLCVVVAMHVQIMFADTYLREQIEMILGRGVQSLVLQDARHVTLVLHPCGQSMDGARSVHGTCRTSDHHS